MTGELTTSMLRAGGASTPPESGIRRLSDETLVVFVSDTHIGGDAGNDIFQSAPALTALFAELAARPGPVELVLGGDFFDFLRITEVPAHADRASVTVARPEYRALFTALRAVASRPHHRVIYLPGNHDAELWWNSDIQATLVDAGVVTEIATAYAACFAAAPDRTIYCEHGNQFDPANAFHNYGDPLDTPLGDHIVTDVLNRIAARGRNHFALDLRELNAVFPLVTIPDWLAARLFYDLLSRALRWIVLPLLVAYAATAVLSEGLALTLNGQRMAAVADAPALVGRIVGELGYDVLVLAIVLGLFFAGVRRAARRLAATFTGSAPADRSGAIRGGADEQRIRDLLVSDRPAPMMPGITGREIAVFVSGHTHAPALAELERPTDAAIVVNSGCWLWQLQPVAAHFFGPPVFVATVVQTHVRLFVAQDGVRVELWQHPQPTRQRLRLIERLAIMGRQPTPMTAAYLLGAATLPALLSAARQANDSTATAE